MSGLLTGDAFVRTFPEIDTTASGHGSSSLQGTVYVSSHSLIHDTSNKTRVAIYEIVRPVQFPSNESDDLGLLCWCHFIPLLWRETRTTKLYHGR